MQDGGDSTPKGGEESGSIKPDSDSEQLNTANSQSDQPEKVYDYYHQHFGVALAAGSQDVRNAEAGSRAAYASTAEVADKPGPTGEKSASWNALKSLIRYQSSTTKEPEPQANFTTSGDSFEAQWLSKSSDDLPVLRANAAPEPEAVRLKWTPIVDNVPEARWHRSKDEAEADVEAQVEAEIESEVESEVGSSREPATHVESAEKEIEVADSIESAAKDVEQSTSDATSAQLSYEEALAATARGDHSAAVVDSMPAEAPKPVAKKVFGKPARMVRRPIGRPEFSQDKSYEDALAATARGEKPILPIHGPADAAVSDAAVSDASVNDAVVNDASSVLDEMNELLDMASEPPASEPGASEASEDHDAAEVRSKFGSMNAFARMQKRTKEQVETKEEQSITGDIPDQVQDEVQSGNWDTKPVAETKAETSEAVMNQWCSTSTGDSLSALPSLDELNSIPTPSVMKDGPPQAGGASQSKPFSLATPKPAESEGSSVTPDMMRQQASRTSWLKAASEYSASVIKAVSDQMKMISQKPKKTTPESPEFHTAELPDQTDKET